MISEWFTDWASPLADVARGFLPPYFEEWAALKRGPAERYEPRGLARPTEA
jgi:hypothetical protein